MRFEVRYAPSAIEDLKCFRAREHRIILNAIGVSLGDDANTATRRRKQLRPNLLAPWELRVGPYRVFYNVTSADQVTVLAVGRKVHNDLFIRGQKVEL